MAATVALHASTCYIIVLTTSLFQKMQAAAPKFPSQHVSCASPASRRRSLLQHSNMLQGQRSSMLQGQSADSGSTCASVHARSPHQLDRDGEALALLHAEPRRAWPPDQRLRKRLQLHQVHDLRNPLRRSHMAFWPTATTQVSMHWNLYQMCLAWPVLRLAAQWGFSHACTLADSR